MTQEKRSPIVVVMGHVDHGKTSLLDRIRQTEMQKREAGGITQSIGAYQTTYNSETITFIDTPGHAAFVKMRSRGGQVADIVVLVVAADDGVMPQTKEAIQHAKFSGGQIIVALNKIDLPGANLNKVKKQLSDEGIVVEEYGGDIVAVETSATTGVGIDELLKQIIKTAEKMELKALSQGPAKAVVVESYLDSKRGPIANVIVQEGVLKKRDLLVCGTALAKVRSIRNWLQEELAEAGPSTPVEVLGFDEVPAVGATAVVALNPKEAQRAIMEEKQNRPGFTQVSAADRIRQAFATEKLHEIPVIVKAQTQGALEAVLESVNALSNEQVKIRVVLQGVGNIGENDITTAIPVKAFVVGFNVSIDRTAESLAIKERVVYRMYDVIYRLLEELQEVVAMESEALLPQLSGQAKVKQLFELTDGSVVAGCEVTEGVMRKGNVVKVVRPYGDELEAQIHTLKKGKDDVGQVKEGEECGILLTGDVKPQVGDLIQAFKS